MSPKSLEALPVELLLEILHYLPTSSLIALKLSSKQLFSTSPTPPPEWLGSTHTCERRSAVRYLGEKKDVEYGRKRCVLCGAYAYPDDLLGDKPICKSHEGRFMRMDFPLYLEPSLKTRLECLAKDRLNTIWVSFERKLCVHRQLVEKWDTSSCDCQCDSCGHWPVRCYVRIASFHPGFRGSRLGEKAKPVNFELTEDGRHMLEAHEKFSRKIWPYADFSGQQPEKYRVSIPVVELAE